LISVGCRCPARLSSWSLASCSRLDFFSEIPQQLVRDV
jgi:hypothetical protein